ncbi:unnamed protein product, partial [Gulo gulo]
LKIKRGAKNRASAPEWTPDPQLRKKTLLERTGSEPPALCHNFHLYPSFGSPEVLPTYRSHWWKGHLFLLVSW